MAPSPWGIMALGVVGTTTGLMVAGGGRAVMTKPVRAELIPTGLHPLGYARIVIGGSNGSSEDGEVRAPLADTSPVGIAG